MKSSLKVSEHFLSFQGEGCTVGKRAVFLRLSGCRLNCSFCLSGNSKILTKRGLLKLSAVKVGDQVWSMNETTLTQEYTEVTRHTNHDVKNYLSLKLVGGGTRQGRIQTTPEHPFWVKNKGWTPASDLKEGDILLEVDRSRFASARQDWVKPVLSTKGRRSMSKHMLENNPMKNPAVAAKVAAYWAKNPKLRPNNLKLLWKHQWFRNLVSSRMITDNPMFDPEIAAKSCNRPFGQISRLEAAIATISKRLSLPLVHNKGKLYIGGRVPDFYVEGKRKVVEVTHSTYLKRRQRGYSEENRRHYAKHGYDCLTLYLDNYKSSSLKEAAYQLVNHVFNGRKVEKISKVLKPLKVHNLTTANHTFFANGVLTHNCDTAEVWKKGEVLSFAELKTLFRVKGYLAHFNTDAHLVVTGGDPLIQQESLAEFLIALRSICQLNHVEIETEGVIMPEAVLATQVELWNVSPKLANSGMGKSLRYHPEVLRFHNWYTNAIFKFPVATSSDVSEVKSICEDCHIPRSKVYLMPICANRLQFETWAAKVAKVALDHNYHFSPRMHLTIWDKSVGV